MTIEITHEDFAAGKATCPNCQKPLLPDQRSEPISFRSIRTDEDDPVDDYDIPVIARDECPSCGEMFEIRFTERPPREG